MKVWILFLVLFSSQLFSESTKGTFVTEPIFNASVYVEASGNPKNPAVVLVHGLGDEASTIWESTVAALENEYYVIIFDLPGFGKSTKSNELYSPENYAKFIHYLMQIYLKKPFHLVGHSMAGAIVLKYTHMYPSDIESLVLIDVAGILHRSAYSNFLTQRGIEHFFDEQSSLIQGIQTPKFNNFINKITDKIDQKMTLDMELVLSNEDLRGTILGGNPSTIAAIALVETNFNGIVQNILKKTMIIWGEKDGTAPLQTGYVLKKLIPNSSLKVIPHAEHVPMLSHEKYFLPILLTHLEGAKNNEKLPHKLKNDFESYRVKIKNVKNKVFTGKIESMTIQDSQKIVIKDATIKELFISNSDVEIVNSTFEHLNGVVLTAQSSRISIIASDILGRVKLYNSKLNLAGVIINAEGKPIDAISRSVVVYSLCQINSKLIHGREVLGIR